MNATIRLLLCWLVFLQGPAVSLLLSKIRLPSASRPNWSSRRLSSSFVSNLEVKRQRNVRHGSFLFSAATSADDGDLMGEKKPTASAQEEARQLLARARKLRADARAMEASMQQQKQTTSQRREERLNQLVAELFPSTANNLTMNATDLASALSRGLWTSDQLMTVLEKLHEDSERASGRGVSIGSEFQIGSTANSKLFRVQDYVQASWRIRVLLDACKLVDDKVELQHSKWSGRVYLTLKSRLGSLQRTSEAAWKLKQAQNNASVNMNEYIATTGLDPAKGDTKVRKSLNVTKVLEKVGKIPRWIPSSLLSFLLSEKVTLSPDDITVLEDEILPQTSFYCTSVEVDKVLNRAALFRGNIRYQGGKVDKPLNTTLGMWNELNTKLAQYNVSNRLQLFLLDDPNWRVPTAVDPEPKPVILAIPAQIKADGIPAMTVRRRALVALGWISAVVSALSYGCSSYALSPNFFESVIIQQSGDMLWRILPLSLGAIAIQFTHEITHRLVAKYRGVKLGITTPLTGFGFIPLFGSLMRIESFPKNRNDIFDVSISGPLVGYVVSLLCIIVGIVKTVYATAPMLASFPTMTVQSIKSSFLIGACMSALAPKVLLMSNVQPIPLHPAFFIGWAGMISNALQLLPVGRSTDGGRMMSAVLGTRSEQQKLVIWTLGTFLLLWFTDSSIVPWYWLAVALFQRKQDVPSRNEVVPVDRFRVAVYYGAVALALLTLIPFPGGPAWL